MQPAQTRRAGAAGLAAAASLGLDAHDAIVLNDSNRLVVRLAPCGVVARVTPEGHYPDASASRELDIARRLADAGAPVAGLFAPRAVQRDGFTITLWTSFEPVVRDFPPTEYAGALAHLHEALRHVDLSVPHVMNRVTTVQRDVTDEETTPDLTGADRSLLAARLAECKQSILDHATSEQILHGEPHPWNVLLTSDGPLFIDFENTARGPVEYDLGWVPSKVADVYPGADPVLVDHCRGLVIAMVAMYRWRRGDQHPSGRQSGVAFLDALRQGPPWPALDDVH